ncbi:methionine--tRNA ligase [Candidatus Woesearchaeota archaeon]|nr:methionine--tRNA ligase [Candidatus Woesearchaeota archaeon]
MPKKILVTSALPYVNNVPHLGTMVCIISADVYSRFLKLKKVPCVFVCGTDEHGTTAEVKAAEEGLTPRKLVDKYFKIHKQVYDWFECDFDCFGRTSSKVNHEITVDIFNKLDKNGYIISDTLEQLYCETDNKYLADRYVEGKCPHCNYEHARGDQCENCGKLLNAVELVEPKCKTCGSTPIVRKTRHLFIDLPKIESELKKWIDKSSKNWAENAKTLTYAWLKEGLKPRCITRDLKWGIPVPKKGFEDKVFYSWFDAPIGYISILNESLEKEFEMWWHNPDNVQLVQFMGKDNIPFHTILFPAFLIGAKDKYTLLHTMASNEYLNYEKVQFSKSRGTGVFGDDCMDTGIPADVWRYYIMVNRPEKTDTEFTWNDFQAKLNNELVANIGNLVNRTVSFVNRFYQGKVPKFKLTKEDEKAYDEIIEKEKHITELLNKVELKEALREIMLIGGLGNKYFQEQEPWKNIDKDKKKADRAVALLCHIVKDLAILIEPYMPNTAKRIRIMLNLGSLKWSDLGKLNIKPGHELKKARILFEKLEDSQVKELRSKYAGKQQLQKMPIDLRVAEIKEVKQHPDADKLYVMKINLGTEERQLVAGLKGYYSEDELLGKKIVIVSNLEPAKLRGVLSQGMLLAADDGKNVGLLVANQSKPGSKVRVEGYEVDTNLISFKEFLNLDLKCKDGKAYYEGEVLKTSKEEIKVEKVLNGDIR